MVTWTLKEGGSINIRDMGNNHLVNTIAYIERKGFKRIRVSFGGNGFDSTDNYYDEETEDLTTIYDEMVTELRLRRIESVLGT